jgi:hypothetical protein
LFREVNERMAELAEAYAGDSAQTFFCECSHIGCSATIELLPSEYSLVRDDPTTFVLIPGHEESDHEEVLVRQAAYLIVRNKPGIAADVARETDSRR